MVVALPARKAADTTRTCGHTKSACSSDRRCCQATPHLNENRKKRPFWTDATLEIKSFLEPIINRKRSPFLCYAEYPAKAHTDCILISICPPWTLDKAMATHSSTLAWKIPWAEEAGRLQSMGLQRVGHDWGTSLSLFPFMHWRRKWHPTPVFLPGESQGRGSLVGCRLWGRTESDTTEVT